MVITWARGGQLFSGGRGYKVRCLSITRPHELYVLCELPSLTRRLGCCAVYFGVPSGLRHHRRHTGQGAHSHPVSSALKDSKAVLLLNLVKGRDLA